MKAIYVLTLLLNISTISHAMNTKVKLPCAKTLQTYLQDYPELGWFMHTDQEISADIPKDFGNRATSPQQLKEYLLKIDTKLNVRCGIIQPTETLDNEILKTIYEIINLVFQDYPDMLTQIKIESEKNKKF